MGAFEDRLAEGYRQAANAPAKMPQPTTPTGALATAVDAWWDVVVDYLPDGTLLDSSEASRFILAALPPGWRLVGPDDVTVTVDGLTSALNVAAVSIGTPFPVFAETRACAAAILAALSRQGGGEVTEPTTPTGKRLNDGFINVSRIEQEAAAAERRRLLEVHMADHDDATGWCPTCALLTKDER